MFSSENPCHQHHARRGAWEALKANPKPEVLIIGGGVNGAGLLRDLSLNGISATLIDSGDFCSGASGASSRMAHGGLRYLEGREFDLVRESARERNMLLHDAGHLVKPLEVVVPVVHWVKGLFQTARRFFGLSDKSGPLSFVALKSGLLTYERFGAIRRALPHHRVAVSRSTFPAGMPKAVCSVISYYDGQITGPEALIFEILDAASEVEGVTAVNHVTWSYIGPGQFLIADPFSDETAQITPRIIINAAGSAIDRVNGRLGMSTNLIRGVKGAHLVLNHQDLHRRMDGRAFYFDDGRGRMVICLPVEDVILIGTTEVETSDPHDHSVMAQEIDYLITSLNTLFEDIHITTEHMVAVTSGIRPLQASTGSATHAARDHALVEQKIDALPVISMVGGKWTTFRAFAQLASDVVLGHLGKARTASTLDRPYPGSGHVNVVELAQHCNFSVERIDKLYKRYGKLAEHVALFCAQNNDGPIDDAPSYSKREIIWLTQRRMPLTLEDLVLRRTNIVMTGRLSKTALDHIAYIMAETLGHDEAWAKAQSQSCSNDPRIIWNGK